MGDDSGNLHQFTGVFVGNPAESGNPWPVNLGTNKLSSPVYDSNSGHVFVGDMGGALHSVTATGTVFGTAAGLGDAIADAPMVDGTAGILFVFVTTSGSYSATGDNAVYQFPTGFTTFGFPGVVTVGTGGAGYYLYAGDFDNVYYESSSPPSGSLYVVGNTGATGGGTLYQIPISQRRNEQLPKPLPPSTEPSIRGHLPLLSSATTGPARAQSRRAGIAASGKTCTTRRHRLSFLQRQPWDCDWVYQRGWTRLHFVL